MPTELELGLLDPIGGGDPLPLSKPRILIGRRPQCDIVLAFPNVSSQHCQMEIRNGFWFVQDLNSRNGIKVNGQRCESSWLHPGDELCVAKHAFRIQYQPSASAPPIEKEEEEAPLSLLEKAGLMRRQASGPRAKASRPVNPRDNSRFDDDENAAVDFLEGES
jgi:adenylate cyclase